MKNRIYFFTGTGNSLKIAKDIAKALPQCELVAIHKDTALDIPSGYDRIGFVFPNYSGGPPTMAADFIKKMKFGKQNDTYIFCVATYGGNAGSVIPQTDNLFKQRGLKLNYGAKIISYPNAVIFYPMLIGVNFFTKISKIKSKKVIKSIVAKEQKSIPTLKDSAKKTYEAFMSSIPESDSGYHVNNDCISCGICKNVCPAKNITLENGTPVFHHQCESCMACIQHCPKRAINYKDKTQKRGRYTHPHISHKDISQYYLGQDVKSNQDS